MRTCIIAEAGVNHNGSLSMALELIDAAAAAGADVVKFQTFKTEREISRRAPKAEYQKQTTDEAETQYEMVKKLELDIEAHKVLAARCRKQGIEFMSSPFDIGSLKMLAEELQVSTIKIPSGEITNGLLLLEAARTGKPVILSTGMSVLGEIEEALGVLAFGYIGADTTPGRSFFRAAYCSPAGQEMLQSKVALLHCTTEYPAPFADVNLRAMDTLHTVFGLPVGFSDHTAGVVIPIAAAARGATIIEKHFTLDKSLPGPDHKASLEPKELKEMVEGIRTVELALGNSRKVPAPSELKNLVIARKSLVADGYIRGGEYFTVDNVTAKRPGTGLSPMEYWDLLGKTAKRNYLEDEVIE